GCRPTRVAAASSTRRAASVTSGPMPSPGSTTIRMAVVMPTIMTNTCTLIRRRLARDRKRDPDLGPLPLLARQVNGAAMGRDDVLRDGEPQPCAGRARTLDEALEDPRTDVFRDALAGIAHGNGDSLAGAAGAHGDAPARRRVADGVGEKIGQDTADSHRVGIDGRRVRRDLRRQPDAAAVREALKEGKA